MSKNDFLRINLGHVLTITIWVVGIIFYGGKIENRVASLDDVVKQLQIDARLYSDRNNLDNIRLARIEEKVNFIYDEIKASNTRSHAELESYPWGNDIKIVSKPSRAYTHEGDLVFHE